LTNSFALDGCQPLTDEVRLGVFGDRLDLKFEKFMLIFDPLSDLLPSECQLTRSVCEIEDGSIGFERNLSANGENALAGGRN
jgi:hypothetical protein